MRLAVRSFLTMLETLGGDGEGGEPETTDAFEMEYWRFIGRFREAEEEVSTIEVAAEGGETP